jgi:hypothetical protein
MLKTIKRLWLTACATLRISIGFFPGGAGVKMSARFRPSAFAISTQ